MSAQENSLEFKGSSFYSLVPFIIFIVITIGLSFCNAADLNMMIGAGVIGLMVGMLFVKDVNAYWDAVLEGLGSKIGMTAVMLWLIVGIYGNILKSGQIVEGLVWLSVQLNVSGGAFTLAAFFFSATFAMATGSGFGTISTMSFILYPAGILLGASPTVLAGAILSGAAFGDNLAPVSDTTIIAATSQLYTHRTDEAADIGGTVRTRFRYVLVAFVLSAILFYVFGGTGSGVNAAGHDLLAKYQNPTGLLLLIPTALVIVLAIRGMNIYATLSIGILAAVVIGLGAGLFNFGQLVRIDSGGIKGAIPDGVGGMTTVSILLIMVVSMGNILIRSGCMQHTVDWLNNKVISTPRGAELAIFSLATIAGILIAAINTIANICVAPFVNAVARKAGLHPYRSANILATTICSFPFFLPFGGCVLLLLGGISSLQNTYPFVVMLKPTDMIFTAFYSWMIWLVMLVACITGWGRSFEGKDGSMTSEEPKA